MLVLNNNRLLLPYAKRNRLIVLENILRRSSDGGISVGEYAAALREHRVPSVSTRSLHTDLSDYAELCDDVIYGGRRKRLSLDPSVSEDALCYFFGPMAESAPMAPLLYSSTVRCLLLARELQADVTLTYRPFLERDDIPIHHGPQRGVPVELFRGSDTAYMVFYNRKLSRKLTLNLSRVSPEVEFLAGGKQQGAELEKEFGCSEEWVVRVEAKHMRIFRFALMQFPNLVKTGRNTAEVRVRGELLQVTVDTLANFFDRLSRRQSSVRNFSNEACFISTSRTG